MPLQTQTVHVLAGQGIDESVRVEAQDVGTANRSNINARFDTLQSIGRRLGFAATSPLRADGTLRSSGRRLFDRNGNPCVIDGSATLDDFSSTMSRWVNHGSVPEVTASRMIVSTRVAVTLGANDFLNDLAYCNGYYAISQQSNILGYISVVDANGVTVRAPELVVGVNNVITLLGAYSTYLLAVGVSTGSANVPAYYLDTSSASTIANGWVSIGNIATDHHNGGGLGNPDAYLDVHSLSDRIAIVYRNTSAGTSRLTVRTFSIAGALDVTTINTSSVTPDAVGIYAAPTGPLWVGWNEGTSVKLIGLTRTALATPLATTNTVITMDSFCSNIHIVWFDDLASGRVLAHEDDRTQMRNFVITTGAVATSGAQFRVPVAKPFGKAFAYNDRMYACSDAYDLTPSVSQGLGVLCDWTINQTWVRPVAMTDPYLSVAGYGANFKPHCVAISSTKFAALIGIQRNGESQAAAIIVYDFASDTKRSIALHSGINYMGGGINSTFDGVKTVEVGFIQRPPKPVLSSSGTGITGTYNYVITYENVDADGRLVQSSVSDAPTAIVVANKTIAIQFRPCAITNRKLASDGGEVRQVIWRSTATGEPPYRRLTTFNNITSSVFTSYSDNTVDISANPLLMGTGSLPGTNGASQDHRSAPGLANLISYGGMLVGSFDSDIYWSSQDIIGEEPWFSPIFATTVPETVTAMSAMDGTLYIFGRRNIYAVAGDAPSDNGTSGGLGTPRRIATDVGCIDSGSVVVTGFGIFFQSDRGIEILSRDGSVSWIGQPVQNTTTAYPYVTSAVLDSRNALVRFTLAITRTNGAVSGTGVSAVFDLTTRSWVSKDIVLGQIASEAAQDAAMIKVNGTWRYGWLGQDGYVYIEKNPTDADAYLDASTFTLLQYEIPPWKLGLQQEQRVYETQLLFERRSAAGITVECAHDYGAYAAVDPDFVWTDASIATERQVPINPKGRGMAVQFRVRDTAPVGPPGTGRGITFIGLSTDIASTKVAERGTPRLPTSLRR